MTRVQKGLIVGLIEVAIVGLVGAKFQFDRARLPRAWAQTVPIDPDLPIRGRYVRLFVAVEHAPVSGQPGAKTFGQARLEARNAKLHAIDAPDGRHPITWRDCGNRHCWVLDEPLAYFISEHGPDPSVRKRDEELWVEVSVPAKGAPRPVRLGVYADGKLRPME